MPRYLMDNHAIQSSGSGVNGFISSIGGLDYHYIVFNLRFSRKNIHLIYPLIADADFHVRELPAEDQKV